MQMLEGISGSWCVQTSRGSEGELIERKIQKDRIIEGMERLVVAIVITNGSEVID